MVTVWRQVFRSIWKTFETRFSDILRSLSGHKQLIIEQAALVQQRQYRDDSQRIRVHIEQYEQDRKEKLIQVRDQEEAEMNRKYRDVLEWFSAAQSTVEDQDICHKTRNEYAGSGQWILKDEKIQNWMEDPPVSSILWMNAIPGAGMLHSLPICG